MLECAIYLKLVIDVWTRSADQYKKLRMMECNWEMVELLLHFLYPFMVASTTVQETASPSLLET